jgi:hypothetical protein
VVRAHALTGSARREGPVLTSLAMKALIFLALGAGPCFATSAYADESFRCGKWIVNSDLSPEEVLAKCGQPTLRESRTEDVKTRNSYTGLMQKVGETTLETWTYDRGTQAAPMVVTIVDGKIKSIDRKR